VIQSRETSFASEKQKCKYNQSLSKFSNFRILEDSDINYEIPLQILCCTSKSPGTSPRHVVLPDSYVQLFGCHTCT
jgi:hypothetical protein